MARFDKFYVRNALQPDGRDQKKYTPSSEIPFKFCVQSPFLNRWILYADL